MLKFYQANPDGLLPYVDVANGLESVYVIPTPYGRFLRSRYTTEFNTELYVTLPPSSIGHLKVDPKLAKQGVWFLNTALFPNENTSLRLFFINTSKIKVYVEKGTPVAYLILSQILHIPARSSFFRKRKPLTKHQPVVKPRKARKGKRIEGSPRPDYVVLHGYSTKFSRQDLPARSQNSVDLTNSPKYRRGSENRKFTR